VLIFAAGLSEFITWANYIAWFGFGLFALATVLTILSGISYVVKNKQVLKDQ
jgi:phosphatidylglycerophosphate synthase